MVSCPASHPLSAIKMGQAARSQAPAAVAWATSLHWEVSSSLLVQTAHGTAPSPETGVACPGQAVLSWPGLLYTQCCSTLLRACSGLLTARQSSIGADQLKEISWLFTRYSCFFIPPVLPWFCPLPSPCPCLARSTLW